MKPYTLAFTIFKIIAMVLFLGALLLLIAAQFSPAPFAATDNSMAQLQQMAVRSARNQALVFGVLGLLLFIFSDRLARIAAIGYKDE